MRRVRRHDGSDDALAGLQAETSESEDDARQTAQAAGDAKMKALFRRYAWRVQGGVKMIARPARTRYRHADQAVTVRAQEGDGGTDEGKT